MGFGHWFGLFSFVQGLFECVSFFECISAVMMMLGLLVEIGHQFCQAWRPGHLGRLS